MSKKSRAMQAGTDQRTLDDEPLTGLSPDQLGATDGARVIRTEYVSLDDLSRRRAPKNAKKHRLDELNASMRRFGYTAPPMINESTGTLIAGHGRIDALMERRAAGQDPPDGIFVRGDKWLVPLVRGISFKTDTEALAYVMADNRLTEIGGYDWHLLKEMANEAMQTSEKLLGTGFVDISDIDAEMNREVKALLGGAAGDDNGLPGFGDNGGAPDSNSQGGDVQQHDLPHIRFGTHRMFMSEEDGRLFQQHIEAYANQYGTLHGLAGLIARTLKPLG